MRNVINWNEPRSFYIQGKDESNPCTIGGQLGNLDGPPRDRLVRSSGRSDVVKSNHVSPTPYHAWDLRSSSTFQVYTAPGSRRCTTPSSRTHVSEYEYSGQCRIDNLYLTFGFQSSGTGVNRLYYPREVSALTNRCHNSVLAAVSRMEVDLGEAIGNVNELGALLGARIDLAARALSAMLKGDRRRAGLYLSHMIAANSLKRSPNKPVRRYNPKTGKFARKRKDWTRYDRKSKRVPDRDLNRALEGVANGYLEGSFGWAPFIRDTLQIRDAILKELNREGTHYSVTRKVSDVRDANSFLGASDTQFRQMDGTVRQGTQIGVRYRIRRSYIAALSSLGLTNPLATLWQLIPLSFVVDWFVSIGAFLRGLTVGHGLTFESGYKTVYCRSSYKAKELLSWRTYQTGDWSGNPFASVSGFAMRRYPLYTFPDPKLTMRFDLNVNRTFTALALVTQLSRG